MIKIAETQVFFLIIPFVVSVVFLYFFNESLKNHILTHAFTIGVSGT